MSKTGSGCGLPINDLFGLLYGSLEWYQCFDSCINDEQKPIVCLGENIIIVI